MRMIPPVMTTPCADHDSRVVVDRRGRSVVDGRGGVVHRWGHDYWRNYTDTDPDVNIGISGYGEPRKKCGAEQKAQCLEFYVRPHSEMFKSTFTSDSTPLRGVVYSFACICCISRPLMLEANLLENRFCPAP